MSERAELGSAGICPRRLCLAVARAGVGGRPLGVGWLAGGASRTKSKPCLPSVSSRLQQEAPVSLPAPGSTLTATLMLSLVVTPGLSSM